MGRDRKTPLLEFLDPNHEGNRNNPCSAASNAGISGSSCLAAWHADASGASDSKAEAWLNKPGLQLLYGDRLFLVSFYPLPPIVIAFFCNCKAYDVPNHAILSTAAELT